MASTYDRLAQSLMENAISGRVLIHCDLNELKAVLGLNFGHWEIFRLLISCLRDIEKLQPAIKFNEIDATVQPTFQRQKSTIEKQVSKSFHQYFMLTQLTIYRIVWKSIDIVPQ